MPERAVGDTKHVGGFGLHAAALVERVLQQRALDARHVVFHAEAFGKGDVATDLRQSAPAGGGCSGARFRAFGRKFDVEFVGGLQGNGALDGVFQLADVAGPFVAA